MPTGSDLRRAASSGLMTGGIMIYLVAVGLARGYLVAGRVGSPIARSASALAAGVVAGGLFSAALLASVALSPGIRSVLVRLSTGVLDFVGFAGIGLDATGGALLKFGLGAGLAVLGGLM